ncbi:3prime5prime-cyclic nucleotide phosphodiesterase [Popillia japonica]|uniref:Phosphodiesterase n=1 Tax=Popillia japonica TaxID=7064 RepID=A0AAW1K328_POPJA
MLKMCSHANLVIQLCFAPVEVPIHQQCFSPEDWILLDAMGCSPPPGCSGRFLTMHKRRRKKLTTRSLLQDHAILDDIHHGQVQRILNQCSLWGFNAFTLETVAGGRSLPVLCVHLFHWYGLLDYFQLDVVRVWKLFTLIEEGYHSTNPYHNSIHATDVTQAMHCFLQEEKIKKHVTPLEVMASLLGAVAHDLDHPGVNQHFLISTSNHLAMLYDNMSVLENHHWRSAIGCLLESGVAEQLTPYQQLTPYRNELEFQIKDLILATDINRQQEFLTRFKRQLDDGTLDLNNKEDRHFILQIALKCADISNPTRPWHISHKWSLKVCDEFFRQGEFERKLNLPVTSICDQQLTSVAKIQSGFFRFVVTPLFSEWHRFLKSNLSTHMINLLESNQRRWEAQEAAENAEETHTELSDAEPEIVVSEEEELTKHSSGTPSITEFIRPPPTEPRRQSLAVPTLESTLAGRRHSVPVNMEPLLPRTIYRRESLPIGRSPSAQSGKSPNSPIPPESRVSSGLREEDELLRFGSQTSLFSSSSGGLHQYSVTEDQPERPLSAENLLPEPSIASMTSSAAASKLTSVLQGISIPTSKSLLRQQTFPPPQPYIRTRYMSATVEMSTCAETAHEDSKSNSSNGSEENISLLPQYTIPSIAVLSPNNGRPFELVDVVLPQKPSISGKREPEAFDKEKAYKIQKMSDSGQRYEKENLDPRRHSNVLSRRRGSAPVTSPQIRVDENMPPAGGGLYISDSQTLRRGSVPVEFSHGRFEDDNHVDTISNITTEQSNNILHYQRRGSAPIDLPPLGGLERRDQLTRHTSLNGKAGRRKKHLRRRSSGGPETVCLPDTDSWTRLLLRRNENPDTLLARRRGSLPIEVLTVGHTGKMF